MKKKIIIILIPIVIIFASAIFIWGFSNVGIFSLGIVAGLIIFSLVFTLFGESDKETQERMRQQCKILAEEREEIEINKRELRKNMREEKRKTFNKDSPTLKTTRIYSPNTPIDAYYSDESVFIAFCLNDLFCDDVNKLSEMKNKECLDETFENYLPKIIENRKAIIFSKAENKFIDEIKKDKFSFHAGSLAGGGGYAYYLPDGTLLCEVQTWVS